jgi:hypothetical protein
MPISILNTPNLNKARIITLRVKYQELSTGYRELEREIERLNRSIEYKKRLSKSKELTAKRRTRKVVKRVREQMQIALKEKIKLVRKEGLRKRYNAVSAAIKIKKKSVRAARAEVRVKLISVQKELTRTRILLIPKKRNYQRGIESGIKRGMKKRSSYENKKSYLAGIRRGMKVQKEKLKNQRYAKIRRDESVDNVVRSSILVGNLSRTLSLRADALGIFLLVGELKSFTFKELKAAFEEMGDQLFYGKITFMKKNKYVEPVGKFNARIIWALTPLGHQVYRRVKSYIVRNFKTQD